MDCYVKPVIIIGKDDCVPYQSPYPNHDSLEELKQKVFVCVKLLQLVTSKLLYDEGFKDRAFPIDPDTTAECISVFRSKYSRASLQSMRPDSLWETLAKEVYEEFIRPSKYELKVVGFLMCTEYLEVRDGDPLPVIYSEVLKRTKGYVMCGIGGFALVGTASLYAWASCFESVASCLMCVKKVDRRKFQDESNMRGTWGACYSSALGSVLHELYHLFDLVHAADGIMGRGFIHIDQFILQNLPSWLPELCSEVSSSKKMIPCCDCDSCDNKSSLNSEVICDTLSDGRQNGEKKFFLDRPSLLTLAFHSFLNRRRRSSADIQRFGASVNSPAGLRLVALRDNDMTLKHWEFLKDPPPKVFTVPTVMNSASLVVFVMNNAGNMAKFDWNR